MIEPIFNMFKVKFDIMDNLNIIRDDTDRVIFYINLENVYKVLYNTKINNYIKALNDPKYVRILICSSILNLASHYKLYCTKYKKDCKVVLYMNYPDMIKLNNREFVPLYKKYLGDKIGKSMETYTLHKIITEVYDFINIIVKYLDDIYFVDSLEIESSVIPYILKRMVFNDDTINTHHVMITKSKYEYQYCHHDFSILEPKGDKSIIVDKYNVIDIYKDKCNVKNTNTISTVFLPMIITILGDKYRNIDKIPQVGLSHIIDMITLAIQDYIITENTTNLDMLSDIISESYREDFIRKYKTVDIVTQFTNSSDSSIDKILSKIEDKFDEYTLEVINDKYFKRSPLMIIDNKRQKYME